MISRGRPIPRPDRRRGCARATSLLSKSMTMRLRFMSYKLNHNCFRCEDLLGHSVNEAQNLTKRGDRIYVDWDAMMNLILTFMLFLWELGEVAVMDEIAR